MVQRKLSLQVHHAQTQSFLHHHDAAKSPRGADLKAKKMKKSGPIKRPKPTPATPPPLLCKTTPNYMKSTTSSDARKEQSSQSKSSSPSPKRADEEAADAKRATCSSTLKDSKFPAFLSLNPSGHSAVKVCPYTYCSLNGHHHPPLRSFLSAARRARAPPTPDDDDQDFFVEIYMPQDPEERVSEDFSQDSFDGSDMDWETLLQYDYEANAAQLKDDASDGCCDEVVMMDEAAQESIDEDGGFNSDSDDAESTQDDHQISSLIQQQGEEEEEEEDEEGDEENYNKTPTKTDAQGQQEAAVPFDDLNEEASGEAAREDAEDIVALLRFAGSSKKLVEDGDEVGGFNPRAPNFLAVEADPEAERVDLKHQDVDERRNSEEWMVDYALRQVVTKLGPAKKRKVALLVEAFEKVMPLPLPPTKFDLHLSYASPFNQPRPMQACN
ncbi:calmodulin binding protein PICBP-like [Salvia miltiorrhiza]|uniref:calmodulin binding protein PICBP-like n=1 Tax=Salvia miltiorrhiza TaxID=226208 RepID=UPI0025ACCEB0|nr:calmodulin binding protein PICBP-like [Salvia miltiorrhiza]